MLGNLQLVVVLEFACVVNRIFCSVLCMVDVSFDVNKWDVVKSRDRNVELGFVDAGVVVWSICSVEVKIVVVWIWDDEYSIVVGVTEVVNIVCSVLSRIVVDWVHEDDISLVKSNEVVIACSSTLVVGSVDCCVVSRVCNDVSVCKSKLVVVVAIDIVDSICDVDVSNSVFSYVTE